MRAWIRLGLLGVAVAAFASVAVVAAQASKRRANLAHCRRNCQELARVFSQEFFEANGFDTTRTGRAFWHELRILSRRTDQNVRGTDPEIDARDCRTYPCPTPNEHRHDWKPFTADPFVCPLYGKTATNPDDPAAIDYRGPRQVPKDSKGHVLIGADRPGNHPDGGGFVFFSDGVIDLVRPDSSVWKAADAALSD